MKKLALLLVVCLLAGTAWAEEEVVNPAAQEPVEAVEVELGGEGEAAPEAPAEAGEVLVAAPEWNAEEAPASGEVLVPKAAPEFVITDESEPDLVDYHGKGGSVAIPEGVATIYDGGIFEDNLTALTLPSTLKAIGDEVFQGQTHLKKVVFNSDVRLGDYAFARCTKLSKVKLPQGFQAVGYGCFEDCERLTAIALPASVTRIGTAAFQGSGLAAVSLPEGLRTIGEIAFAGCPLKQAVIPAGVTRVYGGAFENCVNLSQVTFLNADTVLADGVFETYDYEAGGLVPSCADNLLIRGWPGSTAEAYADRWGYEFESLVQVKDLRLDCDGDVTLTARGAQLRLTAYVWPEDANLDAEPAWTSSDGKVVKVSGGLLTPLAPGEATVTATAGGLSASVRVTVRPRALTLTPEGSQTLKLGKTLRLNAELEGGGSVSWKSSNKKVAKVSRKGLVTPVKKGTVTITASADGVSKGVEITVVAPSPSKLTLVKSGKKLANNQTFTLKKGRSVALKTALTPKYAETTFTWKSNNPRVVTVSKAGKVKAVGKGTATVTCRTRNGLVARVKVKVK